MKNHIVIFGNLNKEQEYSRSYILCKVLEDIGYRLTFCTTAPLFVRSASSPKFKILISLLTAPFRWGKLIFKYFVLPDHDLIYIPYPSHTDALIAYILSIIWEKPLIMDAFLGLYDTIVRDRKLISPDKFIAKLIWKYEKWLLNSMDLVLVDTQEHILMLQDDYGISDSTLKAIPVGIDESLWVHTEYFFEDVFRVVYWSTFIPLHGVEVVAQAIHLIQKMPLKIHVLVIGRGQEEDKFKNIADTLDEARFKWIRDFIPLRKIQSYVQFSHCCLGIFGKEGKAQRAIPYKAYQTLASSKPLITARTKASSTLFTEGVNAILVNPADPVDLSLAIKKLASNHEMAMEIGLEGRKLYKQRLSNAAIRNELESALMQLEKNIVKFKTN